MLSRQAMVDLFAHLDEENYALPWKQATTIERMTKTATNTVAMQRLTQCFARIEDPHQYEFILKPRPDMIVVKSFPPVSSWDKERISAKLRWSRDTTNVDIDMFSYFSPCYAPEDIADDQLFIVPRLCFDKAFLASVGDEGVYTNLLQTSCVCGESQQTALWYSHGLRVCPISYVGTICRFLRYLPITQRPKLKHFFR